MNNVSFQVQQLRSPDKNKRYAACEELRVAAEIPPEALTALELATHDPDRLVADAATRALAVHLQPPITTRTDRASPSFTCIKILLVVVTVGVCLILSLGFFQLFLSFIGSRPASLLRSIGIILSLVGTWLSSASIAGKKRLESWDVALNKRAQDAQQLPMKASGFFHRNILRYAWVMILLMGIMYVMVWVPDHLLQNIGVIALALCVLTAFFWGLVLIFPRAVVLFLAAIALPYRLIKSMEKENSLERTLLFVGAITLTVGILLSK